MCFSDVIRVLYCLPQFRFAIIWIANQWLWLDRSWYQNANKYTRFMQLIRIIIQLAKIRGGGGIFILGHSYYSQPGFFQWGAFSHPNGRCHVFIVISKWNQSFCGFRGNFENEYIFYCCEKLVTSLLLRFFSSSKYRHDFYQHFTVIKAFFNRKNQEFLEKQLHVWILHVFWL